MKDHLRKAPRSSVPPPTQSPADAEETMASLRANWTRRLAWLPIPLLLATMAVLWVADQQGSHESPHLLMALNLVFSTLGSGFVAYLIGRSYLIRGTPGLLMLGCGVISWGAAGLIGVATGLVGFTAGEFDINVFVTIHNTCVWLSALCHLIGADLSLRPRRAMREASLWLATAYTVALSCVALVTLSALAGWTPTFFVQGQGGTPLRYLVLGSATAMFVLTALLLRGASRRPLSAFLSWYTIALGLIAVGLFGIMIEPVHAGPLSWTGRAGQFLGGAYMLIAAIQSVRESRVWGVPLEEALQRERTFVSAVLETVGALVTVLDREGRIVSFNRACEQTTGYSFDVVKGRCFWDVVLTPEEVEPVKAVFARLRAGQFPNEHENYWVAKDGALRLIHWTNSCLTDSWGAVEYVIGTGVEVTEQRRAQQEREKAAESLRESESFQAAVLNSLAAHIAVLDTTGRIKAVNEPWLRFARENGVSDVEKTGVGVNYLDASRAAAVADDPFATSALDGIEAVLQGRQQQFVIEYPCHSPDQQRWFLMHVTTSAAEIGGAIVTHTDITARKQTEEALRASEALYRGIGESIEYGVWVCAPDGRNTYASESFLKMVGITQEQCSNFGWGNLLHPDDADRTIAAWQECVRTGGKWDIEHRFRGVDGQWHHVLARGVPVKNDQGDIICWAGINLDINRLKQAEAALRQSEERQSRIALAGRIGLFEWHADGDSAHWSPVHYELFGLEPGSPVTYQRWLGCVHPDDRERLVHSTAALVEEARGGTRVDLHLDEYRVVHGDGSVHWLASMLSVDPADGKPVLRGSVQEITERKRAEEALKASLNEKEVLLKEIHHRVKNNMQVISSLVDLQANQLQDDATRAVLQDVTHRVRSMALVHEKLYQSADMARVEFAEYVQSLLGYLWRAHGTAASGVRLALDLEPVSLSVNAAVPSGLILNELVSNALKHAFRGRAGGEVTVSLRGGPEGGMCLRVRDNGTGLPPGLDWRQADSLGLRLVQILAAQLRATVEVSGGEGTEFTVTIGNQKT